MKGLRKMLLGVVLAVFVFSWTFGVAAAANGQNWVKQDEIIETYTYNGHTLGTFYAVQGSPDANASIGSSVSVTPRFKYSRLPVGVIITQPTTYPIVLVVSKRVPVNPFTWSVTAFKDKLGNGWSEGSWIFKQYFYPYIQIKRYSYFYNKSTLSADPQWLIAYSVAYRYINGSEEDYSSLGPALKAAFDAVLELADVPLSSAVDFMFDELKPPSNLIKGLGTYNLTVSLKTGNPVWIWSYASDGIIKDQLTFSGAGNWASAHSVGYIDAMDFDAVYTVEAGFYYVASNGYPVPLQSTEYRPTMYLVNVDIELVS